LRVDAIESHTGTLQVAGYALLNIFIDAGAATALVTGSGGGGGGGGAGAGGNDPTLAQPAPGASGRPLLLHEGAFQLPLFTFPPSMGRTLDVRALDAFPRVPCATLLVRVRRVPATAPSAPLPPAVPAPAYASGA
jgi:hypothetical protein